MSMSFLGFTIIALFAALISSSDASALRHKRALDNLMGQGFTGFDKRAFDSLGHDGFSPFDKRNFYPVRIIGLEKRALAKRALDSIGYGGLSDFGYFDKRAFDTLGHDGFSGFERR
ncbi:unnamed protein product, partial [Mesorhabditis belari]|uniref:Orcokinin n=1 Tax=Mesorhabditis belari TaxID=2138241 RepID=A0AAF3ED60_9BILA